MPENDIQHGGLKLKKSYYAAPEVPAEPPPDADSAPTPFHRKPPSSAARRQNILVLASWLFCIALGAALIYLRFFAVLPDPVPELLKRCGLIAIAIIYGISIVLAIRDNMFDGLLAIVAPFYPFYYLYLNSGSIFLRAVATALLAAFGYDCALLVQKYGMKFCDEIIYWINHFKNM
jgi:hypothetical protein